VLFDLDFALAFEIFEFQAAENKIRHQTAHGESCSKLQQEDGTTLPNDSKD
jgi:hypothetical protein